MRPIQGGNAARSLRGNEWLLKHLPALTVAIVAAYMLWTTFALKWPVFISILLLLGALAGLAILRQPLLGYYVLVAAFAADNSLEALQVVTPMKILGAAVFVAWMLAYMTRREYHLHPSAVFWAAGIFLLWMFVCIFVAEDLGAALAKLGTYVQLGFLMVMTATILQTKRQVEYLLGVVVVFTLFTTLYGITQLGASQEVLEGLMDNRNTMGLFLAMCIPMLVYFLPRLRSLVGRVLLLATAGMFALAEALSFSRGGFVLMVVALVLSVALMGRGRRVSLAAGLLVVVGIGAMLAPQGYWERIETIVPAIESGTDTMGLRYRLWKISFAIIKDHPWFGVGPGNYWNYYEQYGGLLALARDAIGSHNTYLNVGVESGVPGTLLFVFLLAATVTAFMRTARQARQDGNRDVRDLALCFAIVVLLFAIGGTKGSLEYFKYLWMVMGIAPALAWVRAQEARAGEPA